MNSLNYIGSKRTLFDTILEKCRQNISNLQELSFMDLFAGTGFVGFNIQPHCRQTYANDLEYYSFVINQALHCCNYTDQIRDIIEALNQLPGIRGLIYQNFSNHADCERMFFTNANAMKCDAIRQHINKLRDSGSIDQPTFYFLVASLLVSVDKVANTSCVYGAYLKSFKASAEKPLILLPIHMRNTIRVSENRVFNRKAEDIGSAGADIVYMDPPYNNRQYSANYSPLNYIAKYDETTELTGKTGLIDGYNRSSFCKKGEVIEAFKTMIEKIEAKHLIMSYNNEGIMEYATLKKILESKGKLKLYKIPYKKFKAQMSVDVESVYEYLWFVEIGVSGPTEEYVV